MPARGHLADRSRQPASSCPVGDFLPYLVGAWRQRRLGARGVRGPDADRLTGPEGGRLSDAEVREAAAAVRELSRGFTRDRALPGTRYMDDPRLLGGYLLFYWTVSFAQTWAALQSAGLARPDRSAPGSPRVAALRILDLGAGPGPSSLAMLAMGLGSVTAADRSDRALGLAREIARRAGLGIETRRVDLEAGERLPGGTYDLVTAVHTLNELWHERDDRRELRASLVESLVACLAPGGRVLLVDPALTRTANEAIEVRDRLVDRGWRVLAPCTWAGRCPALPDGTCHAEVAWDPPAVVRRIGHAARIGRGSLSFSYFLLESPHGARPGADAGPPAGAESSYRVVSERLLAKSGRMRLLLCGPAGRFPLSVDGKAAFPAARLLRSLGRYDLVRVEGAEQRSTGWGLVPASRLEVVVRAPRLGASPRGGSAGSP